METSRLTEALARCLDALATGQTLDECLAAYPDLAAELRPLLETALALRQVPPPTIDPAFRQRLRERLRTAPVRVRPRPLWGWPAVRWAAAAVLATGLLAGTVVSSAESLPGDPLYPTKLAVEEVQVALAPDPYTRQEARWRRADERLRELTRLADRGDAEHLVEASHLPEEFLTAVRNIRMEGCSMKINLALDGLPSFRALPGSTLLPHHRTTIHLCPSIDYIERAWDEAKYGHPSTQPMLEITIPTSYDDSLAPPGKHIMNIFLQYTPYRLREGNWHQLKESYADRVLALVEEYAPGFRNLVLHRQVISPLDLEETYGLTGGNIFHGEMAVDQLFFLRPVPGWAQYRTPLRGLYLCGSGTHPGGGVMGAPGYNAAREILRQREGS